MADDEIEYVYSGRQLIPKYPDQYYLGLDLGQSVDPSALAIVQKIESSQGPPVFHCRHLRRFDLGTSYPVIVKEMIQVCETPPLSLCPNLQLAIDGTGVGRAVVDLFRRARINARLF